MNEIWKKVKLKGFSHYRVSNLGRLFNTKTKYVTRGFVYRISSVRGPLLMFGLSNKSLQKTIPAHKLVFSHFQLSQLKNYRVWHIDYNGSNNKNVNLLETTHGDCLRRGYEVRNKKRGVYKWTDGQTNKFRATLKIGDKVVTLGYTNLKKDAEILYQFGYSMIYGVQPYV